MWKRVETRVFVGPTGIFTVMLDVPSLGGPHQRGRALRKLRSHWSPLMWKTCLLTHLRKCTQTIKRLHKGNVY